MPRCAQAQVHAEEHIRIKRVYEGAGASDGKRILVDRLWPRGLSKARAQLAAWCKDIAPSDALRIWFHAHPDQWASFRTRYLDELAAKEDLLRELRDTATDHPVTLLFASKDKDHNNAAVLRDLLLDQLEHFPKKQTPVRRKKSGQAKS